MFRIYRSLLISSRLVWRNWGECKLFQVRETVKSCKTHVTCGNLLVLPVSAIQQTRQSLQNCGNPFYFWVSAISQTHRTFKTCGNHLSLSISAILQARKSILTCGKLLVFLFSASPHACRHFLACGKLLALPVSAILSTNKLFLTCGNPLTSITPRRYWRRDARRTFVRHFHLRISAIRRRLLSQLEIVLPLRLVCFFTHHL